MARLYEMCNEIASDEILMDREELTDEEKESLLAELKEQGIIGKNEKKKKRRSGRYVAGIAAAAVLAIVIVPNVSPRAAYAMSQIPVLGNVIKMITVREYNYDSERFEANIKEAQLVQEVPASDDEDIAVTEKTNESINTINEDIGEMTDRLIEQFEADVELGESYGGVYVDPQVVTDTDQWFTVRIDVLQVAGSGAQYQYFYHIDKTTGEIAGLKDLFVDGADYITPISENIIKQMREQMAADENIYYWVDDEEVPEWNFRSIKEDQNFYLNEQGQIVICFDEYEVAPGCMGLVEFTIEDEAVADILK
ncbi:MAG: RsiV family protein [Lachnospiraceae bacterium]